LATLRALHDSADATSAQPIIAGAIPPLLASVLEPAEFASIYERLKKLPEPPPAAKVRKEHLLGALAVFLLVFLSTFPVVIPFMAMSEATRALRVSNAVAIVMLFFCGFAYGRLIGRHQWLVGIMMVIVGAALSAFTMALGG
jgi:VIT1/CCC1 family predicted Fe2+/Mn2+ transporter